MNEKPLERLNYFNGQRLQAADLKLEQDYHIRVRRWLNRSLYSSGIASGLSVYAIKDQPRVRVTPGLAIDQLGREIILLDEQIVDVVGTQHDRNGSCDGPYLTIRYQEDVIAKEDLCCSVGGSAGNRSAWGGPARILTGAVLELNAELPSEASGRIPLACLTLAKGCSKIETVDTGVRRYIGESSANKVKQYALEGVRDLDSNNPARIYFHIRGRQPTSVTLYLRSELLPTLYYTEMGHHTHANGGTLTFPPHTHGTLIPGTPNGTSGEEPAHTPTVSSITANVDTKVWNGMIDMISGAALSGGITAPMAATLETAKLIKFVDEHVSPDADLMDLTLSPHFFHTNNQTLISGQRTVNMQVTLNPLLAHSHVIEAYVPLPLPLGGTGSAGGAGVDDAPDYRAREGRPLQYVDDLQIAIDDRPVTEDVRRQVINNSAIGQNWARFGIQGQGAHPFVVEGTGAIRIDYLPGVVMDEREHWIDLSVEGVGNGGRIHFNLYVE
ncbi:MAG: hypothetical protein WDO56_07830 [Gammaproteobacteria bacterium]